MDSYVLHDEPLLFVGKEDIFEKVVKYYVEEGNTSKAQDFLKTLKTQQARNLTLKCESDCSLVKIVLDAQFAKSDKAGVAAFLKELVKETPNIKKGEFLINLVDQYQDHPDMGRTEDIVGLSAQIIVDSQLILTSKASPLLRHAVEKARPTPADIFVAKKKNKPKQAKTTNPKKQEPPPHKPQEKAQAKPRELFRFFNKQVLCTVFTPDGDSILTGGYESNVLWSLKDGKQLRTFIPTLSRPPHILVSLGKGARTAAISPDGRQLMLYNPLGSYEIENGRTTSFYPVWVFNIDTGKQIRRFEVSRGRAQSVPINFSLNGRYLVSRGMLDHSVCLWNVETGKLLNSFPALKVPGFNVAAGAEVLSPDGKKMLMAGPYGELWNTVTGKKLRTLRWPEGSSVNDLCKPQFSPDGRLVLILFNSRNGRNLCLWDVNKNHKIRSFSGIADEIVDLAFSPNGRIAGAISRNNEVCLWHTTSGKKLLSFQAERQKGTVATLAFSPDGTCLATSGGNVVQVWELPHWVIQH